MKGQPDVRLLSVICMAHTHCGWLPTALSDMEFIMEICCQFDMSVLCLNTSHFSIQIMMEISHRAQV